MQFSAAVIDKSGNRRKTELSAASESDAAAILRDAGAIVLSVKQIGSGRDEIAEKHRPFLRLRSFDTEIGFRQLSSMLRSGVTLLEALETVADQSFSTRARISWLTVRSGIASGRSFAAALEAQGRRFGKMEIALVRVGEKSGELVSTLQQAAVALEGRRLQRTLLVNALAYPVFAIIAALGVCGFLVASVIPKIAEFLESGGSELPPMTQNLVDASAWLRMNGMSLAGAALAVAVVFFVARLFKAGRLAIDTAALHIPVTGKLLKLAGTAVFSRSLGTLVESGVSLLEALDVVKALMKNSRLAAGVESAYSAVLGGGALSPALKASGTWTAMLPQMVAVGEKTGSLGSVLGEVADFHEMMLSAAIKRFGTLLEPVMIIFTGGIVGYVYVAFFVALFSMAGMS